MWLSYKLLSYLFLWFYVLSFFMVFSASSFLSIWVSMELNLLGFLGVMKFMASSSLDLSVLKYFLSQALGSLILVLVFSSSLGSGGGDGIMGFLFNAGLLLKLGMAPFHSWYLAFAAKSSVLDFWLVSVPQKLMVLWVYLMFSHKDYLIIFSVALTLLVSGLGAVSSLRLILVLAYSSMMFVSWVLFLNLTSSMLVFLFLLYGGSLGLVLTSMEGLDQQSTGGLKLGGSSGYPLHQLGALMNLAGVPPFMNMWSKVSIINLLSVEGGSWAVIIYIFSSVLLAYSYFEYFLYKVSGVYYAQLVWGALSVSRFSLGGWGLLLFSWMMFLL